MEMILSVCVILDVFAAVCGNGQEALHEAENIRVRLHC